MCLPCVLKYYMLTILEILGNHLNDLTDRLNTELIFLNNWFKANKLSLNTKKSLFYDFSSFQNKTKCYQ